MINPFYFPNIYIEEDVSDVLKKCFDQICVYGVSASGFANTPLNLDEGFLNVVTPDYNDADQFNEFLLTGFNSKPLHDPNRAFELTKELQKRVEDASLKEDAGLMEHYRVMRSRIFLQMAYEYDMQSNQIQEELLACKKKEQELIKELQGFEDVFTGSPEEKSDEVEPRYSPDFQIEKRFESWTNIFHKAHDEVGKVGNGFYITDAQTLIEYIIEFEPKLEKVCSIQPDSVNKEELSDLISDLIKCDWETEKTLLAKPRLTSDSEETAKIHLYILPETNPAGFFTKFLPVSKEGETLFEHRKVIRNTVIGYIDI